jgi:hypothetical protein
MMLVALGDKPARRAPRFGTQTAAVQKAAQSPSRSAKPKVNTTASDDVRAPRKQAARVPTSASGQPNQGRTVEVSAQTEANPADAEAAQVDAELASELIASGVTTQSIGTVVAVLAASRGGASINAAAKASGINYRTAQRIVEAAAEYRQQPLLAHTW